MRFDPSEPNELRTYVGAPDGSFAWSLQSTGSRRTELQLTAQTWRGIPWVHSLSVHRASELGDTAILYITGGEPNLLDQADAGTLAELSGLPVATLFNMPNQPLFELEEDALIAYTFDRYLEGNGADWPLLLPMAKSAIRAMDAVQAWSGGRIGRFVLMGESKRGWTAWLAAATHDPRIIGIVPAVFDNLDIPTQMAHQLHLWHAFSEEISDYTKLDLQSKLTTKAGATLSRIVDPCSYSSRVRARILQVHGANDPYWAVDARRNYERCLPESATVLTLPNEGHVFAEKALYFATAAAFALACSLNAAWPSLYYQLDERNIFFVKLILSDRSAASCTYVRLFVAETEDAVFSSATWEVESHFRPVGLPEFWAPLPEPRRRYQAAFILADFELPLAGRTHRIALSTSTVLRQRA